MDPDLTLTLIFLVGGCFAFLTIIISLIGSIE